MDYPKFGLQTKCIMGNSKIGNGMEILDLSDQPRSQAFSLFLSEPGNEVVKLHHIERKEVRVFEAICVKLHPIVIIVPLLSITKDQIQPNDYLRVAAFEKEGNLLKEMTSNKY